MDARPARIVLPAVVISFVAIALAGQERTSTFAFFQRIVESKGQVEKIVSKGKTIGTFRWWRVNNPVSSYNGLILCWAQIPIRDVSVVLDGNPALENLPKLTTSETFIAVSGGSWQGSPSAGQWQSRNPAGLLIADGGRSRATTNRSWFAGGVLVRCGDQLSVLPVGEYRRPASCAGPFYALQSNMLLVQKGKVNPLVPTDVPANRVAIGTAGDQVIVAGAFNEGGALQLRDFAEFIAAAASRRPDAMALNLEGGCAAQIYLPDSKRFFGGC